MVRFVWAATVCAACSLTTDLNDLGGDAAADATFDAPDAPVDASFDTLPSDARSDCGHTFCDNFDDHALGTGWDNPPPASVTLSDVAVSPPSALQAFTLARDAGGVNATLAKAFASAKHVEVQFDMRTFGAAGLETDIVSLVSPMYRLTVYGAPASAHGDLIITDIDGGPSETDMSLMGVRFEFDAGGIPYHHYDIVFVLDSTPASYVVKVDGATAMGGPLPATVTAGPVTLTTGILSTGGLVSSFTALVDNVLVDLQ